MERSILISIRPEWVEKILNGEKTIEIRKSIPKCKLPCKVYIYCTKSQKKLLTIFRKGDLIWSDDKDEQRFDKTIFVKDEYFSIADERHRWLGKVVAEFTLNTIDYLVDVGGGVHYTDKDYNFLDLDNLRTNSCLTDEQIYQYLGLKKDSKYYNDGYVWHIDNLKIYDNPKELSNFKKENKCHYANYEQGCCFETCTFFDLKDCDGKYSKITVAPQSWCYVEVL